MSEMLLLGLGLTSNSFSPDLSNARIPYCPETSTKNTKFDLGVSLGFNLSCRLLCHLWILTVIWKWIVLTIILYARWHIHLIESIYRCQTRIIMPWLQRVQTISASFLTQKETLPHIIISQALLMVFEPFSDFGGSLQRWVNLQWKMVKIAAEFFIVKLEGSIS